MPHTPGPWTCDMDGYIMTADHETEICQLAGTTELAPQQESDADLIANAPEAHELVEAFLSYLEDDSRSEARRQACIAGCKAYLAKVPS